ncbi:hypothetical protein B0H13DRAFT_2295836 [Mycena leptocephala]|nr:hypothetical protein B0H13DRAFT_2295836 [Mycena leptocephala]
MTTSACSSPQADAQLRVLHLLAVLLLLQHTDPHAAPISAPPAYTPPAQLGLAPSRPPSPERSAACRTKGIRTYMVAADPHPPRTSTRIPVRAARESRTRERKTAVKGVQAKQETKKEKKKRKARSRASSPPTAPPASRTSCSRMKAQRGRHRWWRWIVGRRPGSTARELWKGEREDVEVGGRIKQRSERRGKAGPSKKGKRAAKSGKAAITGVQPAVPTAPTSRAQRRGQQDRQVRPTCTAAQTRVCALRQGRWPRTQGGESHLPARRLLLRPWHWDPATHVRRSWPVLKVERGEREKEEGEEMENTHDTQVLRIAKVAPAIPDARCTKVCCGGNKRISGGPERESKKRRSEMNGQGADALHRATTGNALRLGMRLKEQEGNVHREGQGPASYTLPPVRAPRHRLRSEVLDPAHHLVPNPDVRAFQLDGSTLLRSRTSTIEMHHASWILSQPRQWIGR